MSARIRPNKQSSRVHVPPIRCLEREKFENAESRDKVAFIRVMLDVSHSQPVSKNWTYETVALEDVSFSNLGLLKWLAAEANV